MLIAIDCGNTSIAFGLYEGRAPEGRFRAVYRMETDAAGADAKTYAARLARERDSAGLGEAPLEGAAIACVVPEAAAGLVAFAREATGTEPGVVGAPGVETGARALIDDPAEVGADRLVNAVAAHALHPGPAIVLDFGTATTFDVVTAEGDFAGGVIAPGVNLALDALHQAAALLPAVDVVKPERVIGAGTVAAMQSGIYWGYVGLIEGIVARIRTEYGEEPDHPFKVIATGGLAPLFAEGTGIIDAAEPELTLLGLVLVHQRNRPS